MGIKFDENCVCYNKVLDTCVAITQSAFNRGHRCYKCPFMKTEKEYNRQTGQTYEEAMKEVEAYGSND